MKARTALVLATVVVNAAAVYAQTAVATPPSGPTREVHAQSAIALRAKALVKVGSDV